MAILPVNTNINTNRRRGGPVMNYATGQPGQTMGGGQSVTQPPVQGGPPRYTGFAPSGMAQGYPFRNMGFAAMPRPAQRVGMMPQGFNPMAGQLAGQMGNVQVPAGMNIANFSRGNFQGGQSNMQAFPLNPNMLVQMRRGILPIR